MNKQEVYKIIEEHYRDNFNILVKKFRGLANNSISNSEDIVQTAYLRCFEYWESFNVSKSFDNWFSTILSNSFKDWIAGERKYSEDENLSIELEEKPKALNKVILKDVQNYIAQQSDKFRKIYILYFLFRYNAKEIGKILNQNPNSIRQYVYEFRKELRNHFQTKLFQ